MADRPGRRQQPFRFWFPHWSRSSRASHRPPPPSSSMQPATQSTPPSSQVPAPTAAQTQMPLPLQPPSQRSSQQLTGDERAPSQPPPSPTTSHRFTNVFSSSSRSRRRQSLPLQATQPPTPQGESQTKELSNELGTQVGQNEAQLEEKSSHSYKRIEVESLQNFGPKTSLVEPLEAEASTTQQRNKTKSESKQFTLSESTSIKPPISKTDAEVPKEFEPGIDIEPQKEPQVDVASTNQSLNPEAELEKIQEEKPVKDLEAELKQYMNHMKVTATEKITEEIQSKEEESKTVESPQVPTKASKPKLTITVSDSNTTNHHTGNRKLVSPDRVTEEHNPEEPANGTLKESIRHSSAGKESTIVISTMPQASSPNLLCPSMRKDLKEGLSRLVQKLSIGHQNRQHGEQGVNIITLAGENKGAIMHIGSEGFRGEDSKQNERNASLAMAAASINSNVQGINNSILDEANYSERNPGVHMTIHTKPTAPLSIKGKAEPPKSQKVASSITQPQKLTLEPNVRRRCLRGLFLESSEDDNENPHKIRRHGCRFSCDEKKKENVEAAATLKN